MSLSMYFAATAAYALSNAISEKNPARNEFWDTLGREGSSRWILQIREKKAAFEGAF